MLHVETCRSHHIPEMALLYNQSFFRQWKPEDFQGFVCDDHDGFHKSHCNPKKAWGLFVNDLLMGFILVHCVEDECEIITLCVCKKARRKGYASQLLSHILSLPYALYSLEVNEHNQAAIGLYRRHGFQKIGSRQNYYRRKDGNFDSAFIFQYSKK